MASPTFRAASLAICASLAARAALAQTDNKVVAEALFQEGRRLMEQRRPSEACPKFAESQRADPSPSTLLNLASCYEALGRVATAWATYKEAASAANAAGRSDYVAVAQKRANALTPRLARLTVTAPSAPDGLVVRRDGIALESAAFGVAIPIDPGEHTITATAPGRTPWQGKIQVSEEGSSLRVSIPQLDAAHGPTPPLSPAAGPTPDASAERLPPPSRDEAPAPGHGTRVAGYAIGAAGIGIAAVGGILSIAARSRYTGSLSECSPDDRNRCSQSGVDQRNDARSLGDTATVVFVIGGAAVAGGLTLLLLSPTPTSAARLELTPGPGGLGLRGAF